MIRGVVGRRRTGRAGGAVVSLFTVSLFAGSLFAPPVAAASAGPVGDGVPGTAAPAAAPSPAPVNPVVTQPVTPAATPAVAAPAPAPASVSAPLPSASAGASATPASATSASATSASATAASTLPPVAEAPPPRPAEPFAAALWQRLVDDSSPALGAETINLSALKRFYAARNFAPLWKTGNGAGGAAGAGHEFSPAATVVAQTLQDADSQGLFTAVYHGDAIAAAAAAPVATPLVVELLLTDGLLRYVGDVNAGRIAPRKISDDLDISLKTVDAPAIVTGIANSADPVAALAAARPQTPLYQGLVRLLADLRSVERHGGWPTVPALRGGRAKLEMGGNDAAMPALRNRLIATGDFQGKPSSSSLYDAPLKAAVSHFQARHGLEPDGVIGASTLKELNVPVAQRIAQTVANLERNRWLPVDLGQRYVLVNAPDFRLTTFADGKIERTMRVIVGTKVRRTPLFSSVMTSVILNPTWTMPIRLAKEDYLPKLRRNPNYLAEHGFTVYSGWGDNAKPIDPTRIDWNNIGSGIGRLKLREEPGPNNPLGRIKFNIRNDFDVYLHDTPNRDKFGHSVRTFSSGCVRVGEPMGLADFVFADLPQWDAAHRQPVLDSLKTRFIILPNPIPVHLVYRTAWLDDQGTAQFRVDIYDRDSELLAALARTVPATKVALSGN